MQLDDDPREDLGELRLDGDPAPLPESDFDPGFGDDGPNWPLIWVGVLLLVAILGVYFGFFRGRQKATPVAAPEAATASAEQTSAPDAGADAEAEIELPKLDASDKVVRQLVSRLSDHPKLAAWLATDELLRKFAVAVDNVAEGRSPRQHLRLLAPQGSFLTTAKDGQTIVDPAGYRRYDSPAQLFASLDAAAVARLYRSLSPLVGEAYRDLGYPGRDFDATMALAIDELVSTPIPTGDIMLVPKVSSYEFADPALEKLSPAQKHLLRMGPENARRVQTKLAEIRDELGLEP